MEVPPTNHSIAHRDRAVAAILLAVSLVACAAGSANERTDFQADPRRPGPASPANGGPAVTFAPSGPTERGLVAHITDGDTIRVVIDGQEQRLRYIGIDTPESVAPNTPVEPFAEAAADANAELVNGEHVVLERDVSETDRFDRLLRYVWLEPDLDNRATDDDVWRLVNLELVREGLAEAVDYPPDVKYSAILEAAESEARAAGRGIWGHEENLSS